MKKQLLVWTLMLGVGTAWLGAEGMGHEEQEEPVYGKPVLVEAIGFQARYEDGVVKASWKKYKRDDFKYYKVVKSATNRRPVYPEDHAVFFTEDVDETSGMDTQASQGIWYYRVCVITQNNDRWVSGVVRLGIQPQRKSAPPSAQDFE